MGRTMVLDADQERAAHERTDCRVVVVAGPGAGKTAVIAERVAHMVRERIATPGQIVCVTFTRAMAADLRRRIAERIGDVEIRCKTCNGAGRTMSSLGMLMDCADCCGVGRQEVAGIECGTLHSLSAKWVRQAIKGEIAGRDVVLASEWLDEHAAESYRIAMPWEVDAAVDEAAKALGKRVTKRALKDGMSAMGPMVATWEPQYEARRLLRSRNLLRFDDLTALAAEIVNVEGPAAPPISRLKRRLIVDEAQDLRGTAALIVSRWGSRSVTAVGDDAQAIYGFLGPPGGAFRTDGPPGTVTHLLGANYRGTASVAAFGAKLRTGLASMRDATGAPLCTDLPARVVRVDEPGSASVLHVTGVPHERCGTDTGGICEAIDGGESEIVRVVQDHMQAAGQPGDVVVLAATRAELDEIERAMEDAFVPVARLERKPLAGLPESRMPALLALARAHSTGQWSEDDALAVGADQPGVVSRAVAHALNARIGLGTALDAIGAGVRLHVEVAGFPGWAKWAEATPDPWPVLIGVAAPHPDSPNALRDWLAAELETRRDVGIWSMPTPADLLTWLASDEATRTTREPHAVCLATFHGSKGLEWPRVVVVGACEGANPPKFARSEADAADWHRAFYVACTRAREHLTILRPEHVRGKYRGANAVLAAAGLDIEDGRG